jgi:hypothetical protein
VKLRFRKSLTALAGVLVFAGVTDAAPAQGPPPHPGGSAAVAQYVEQIPTSSGSQATGVGKVKTKPLAPAIRHRLTKEAGADAPLLQQVATSSTYGAPQHVFHTSEPAKAAVKAAVKAAIGGQGGALGTTTRRGKRAIGGDATPRRALSAAVNVVSDGSDGRLIGLVVLLAAITTVAVASAAFRQRSLRETTRR